MLDKEKRKMKKPKSVKPRRRKKTRVERRKNIPVQKTFKEKTEGFTYEIFNSPFQNISDKERESIAKEIAKKSNEKYIESLSCLQEMARNQDPLSLLSILAAYATTGSIKNDGATETFLGEEMGQPQVELMQAICLSVPWEENQHLPPTPQNIEVIFETLKDISLSFFYKRAADIDINWNNEERSIRQLQEFIRGKTQIVRNWGYYHHVISILKEIYSPLDDLYVQNIGFSASSALDFFTVMVKTVEEKMNERLIKLAELYATKDACELIYKYHEWRGLEKAKADAFITNLQVNKRDIDEVFAMVLSHADLCLSENYTFKKQVFSDALKLDDTVINKLLETFSFEFGDLKEENPDYIFLANPIWQKPIIRISDSEIFCPIPYVFFSFAHTTLDALLRTDEKYSRILSDHRSHYLENKIEQIVKSRFPEAVTISGLKWRIEEVEYETDLITFIDSQIIIIEAKSGKISDTALRGGPKRLQRDLSELLIEPSQQSLRLKNLLLELIANPLKRDPIREQLPVDLEKIYKVHRVSISLEDFATIQANIKNISDTGWLPENFEPCPTFCLGDFQTIFDILEHPVQIIHYIQQREILEKNVKYMGDELDLLGWYIETLFNIPDFGEEFSQIMVTGNSEVVDKYYNGRDHGLEIEKPEAKLHFLFKKILMQLEERKTERWTEIGVILHMFTPDDQKKLATLLPKLKRNVEKNWRIKGHKNMLILNPNTNSKFALCYIYFNNKTAKERDQFIEAGSTMALEPEHVTHCLVIAKNIDDDTRAYDFIALAEAENF